MSNIISQFRTAMCNVGLQPPIDIEPGKFCRFPGIGKKRSNTSGWCKLFEDLNGGVFGDFSSGLDEHWQADNWNGLSSEKQQAFRQRCETERQQRLVIQQQRHQQGVMHAKELLTSAKGEISSHPYAVKKKVALGEHIKCGTWPQRGWDNVLLVPLYNKQGDISTLQAINIDGEKDFLKGGRKKGCFYPFGKIRDADKVLIGEGVATVAAVYAVTHTPAVAAMDAGNLYDVALVIRELAPNAEILFLADNDISDTDRNVGVEKARYAAKKVDGSVAIPEMDGKKCDFWDLWHEKVEQAVLDAINNANKNVPAELNDTEDKRKNQADELVEFVKSRVELFHDKNRHVYAQDLSTRETRRLDGGQFKDWLFSSFYSATKKSPREQSIREALNILSGLARHEGKCCEVHIRVAFYEGAYYLDLAQMGTNRAACITAEGWSIVDNHEVRFLRPETLQPLPIPVYSDDMTILSELWPLINIPENNQLLVLAWLIDCLRPDTPFPVLELIGEQGSAKSTTQAMLRRLIDPNTCDLRAVPKKIDDIFVIAALNWIVSYENVSYLSPDVQDTLCIISTGGGLAKRRLYTDGDESVVTVKRPIMLNGISAAITAQDLIDRAVSIETQIITERLEVNGLWQRFNSLHVGLLGALLSLFSQALALLPTVELPAHQRPRLMEFALLGMAIAKAMKRDESSFLEQFHQSRQEAIERTIDASPVASALCEWLEERKANPSTKITMTLKELLTSLNSKKPDYAENWPRSPKGLGDVLRRIAPALRYKGIDCHSLKKHGGQIFWEISCYDTDC